MAFTIPSAALRQMPEDERRAVIEAAFIADPGALRNYLTVLDARLRVFEHRYELPTARLAEALARGEVGDTADVSDWLFWAGLRSQLAGEARA